MFPKFLRKYFSIAFAILLTKRTEVKISIHWRLSFGNSPQELY
jgi:hypothetical protein